MCQVDLASHCLIELARDISAVGPREAVLGEEELQLFGGQIPRAAEIHRLDRGRPSSVSAGKLTQQLPRPADSQQQLSAVFGIGEKLHATGFEHEDEAAWVALMQDDLAWAEAAQGSSREKQRPPGRTDQILERLQRNQAEPPPRPTIVRATESFTWVTDGG